MKAQQSVELSEMMKEQQSVELLDLMLVASLDCSLAMMKE